MDLLQLKLPKQWYWVPAVALAYYCVAIAALSLSQNTDGIAAIWPASGVFVAALMLAPRSRHLAILISVAAASIISNMQAGSDFQQALIYSMANCIEAIIISRIACKADGSLGSMDDPRCIGRFFLGALAGGLTSATIATLFSGNLSYQFFQSWFVTVALGALIVAPVIVMVVRAMTGLKHDFAKNEILLTALILLAMAMITLAVFSQSKFPLLFLLPLCVIAATYRLGAPAAAICVILIAGAGSWATAKGYGPLDLMQGTRETKILFFQFYLLCLLCGAWPLSALLAQKTRLFAQLASSKERLEQAERVANIAHWYFDFTSHETHWSDEMYRIYGLPIGEKTLSTEETLALYHPDERDHIRTVFAAAMRQQTGFAFEARLFHPDGQIRHVSSIGKMEYNSSGEVTGMFGLVKDITERVAAIEALNAARHVAEERTQAAIHLSETDQLTNIPNRRKVVDFLEKAIANAKKSGKPLSIGILDVDHFKSINDRFGHQIGDDVLEVIAATSQSFLRDSDCVGRVGGEEFLFVLPGATSERAMEVAERVREGIMGIEWEHEALDQVTVCIGVAQYVIGRDETWLMRVADEALYAAKKAGRNRLMLAA